jgi:hypothetical protein
MQHSQSINELAAALAKAQAEMRNPVASATNSFQKYEYARANDYLNMVRGALCKHDLSFVTDIEGSQMTLMIIHSSGQWMKFFMPLRGEIESSAKQSSDQAWGSHLTYRKKYLISLVFGIHGCEDDDSATAAEEEYENRKMASDKKVVATAVATAPKPVQKSVENPLSTEQKRLICADIGGDTAMLNKLLSDFGAEDLDEIPSEAFDRIIRVIRAKKGAQGKG